MKKVFSFVVVSLLFICSLFSKNFFSTRYFESRTDFPINISNNVFSLNDFFVKDLVIDLFEMADSIPEKGYETVCFFSPSVSSKITFPVVSFGSKLGVDIYQNVNISKGLFDLVGKGYNAGDTLKVGLKADMDVFAYMDFPVDVNIGQVKFNLTPSVFLPVLALEKAYTKVSFHNGNDGKINIDLDHNYSAFISSGIYNVNKDTKKEIYPFLDIKDNKLLGFDLGCSCEFPILEKLNLLIAGRFPIISGRLDQRASYLAQHIDVDAESLDDIIFAKSTDEYLKNSGTGLEMEKLKEPVFINRPLRLNVYAVYEPFKFISLVAGGGIVFKHAFDYYDVSCYPEYYGGATFNFFDVLKASVSTEYTNQIFRHQVTSVFNLRFFEIDLGISMESADFLKSFGFYGVGASIGMAFGY